MANSFKYLSWAIVVSLAAVWSPSAQAANVSLVGAHYDIGGTFFPGGGLPYVTVPWRTDSAANVHAVSNAAPNRYYGTAGYALFATRFEYPNANATPGNANVPIGGNGTFQNLVDLPSWVAGHEVIANRLAGGFAYALIDDPGLMSGIRHWTFDGTNYPPADGTNGTGQNPYVKLGVITGDTISGRVDPGSNPDRWAFTVGAGAPYSFRIGVMTDGMDDSSFAPAQVFLRENGGDWVASSAMPVGTPGRNRFVDMTFFDIVGAAPGDTFTVSATAPGRISGFSFDVVQAVPEPASLAMIGMAIVGMGSVVRSRRGR